MVLAQLSILKTFTDQSSDYSSKRTFTYFLFIRRYYSSGERKYLQLNLLGNLDTAAQQRSLKNGFELALLLNRTLILPKFYCENKVCNLMKRFPKSVKLLYEKLGTNYREHMFLENPLVPENVRNSVSKEIHIALEPRKDESGDGVTIALSRKYLNAHVWHQERYLEKFKNYSVIVVSISPALTLGFDQLANVEIFQWNAVCRVEWQMKLQLRIATLEIWAHQRSFRNVFLREQFKLQWIIYIWFKLFYSMLLQLFDWKNYKCSVNNTIHSIIFWY